MKHTELQAPVALSDWQAYLRAVDPAVIFQDYQTLYEGPTRFTVTDELNQIVEDFGSASHEAVYAVLGEEIYAVWIDPFHNYLAVVCTKASGDPEDATLIMCYDSKRGPHISRELPGNVTTWEEGVWSRIQKPDLSDMDRVHQAAATDQLSDLFVRIASRAP